MANPLPHARATADEGLTVGTLSYTRLGLASVFFWMLWGDLCVNIMEAVLPKMLPVQLDKLGASATLLGTITVSVGAAVEVVVSPVISTFSDRTRTGLGRRRPFVLYATPALAFFMCLLGFAEKVGAGLHRLLDLHLMTPEQLAIGVIAGLYVLFQIFNVVVLGVYYYMIADVVPRNLMGTFTCLYKVMGTLGAVIFNTFIFRYADAYQWQIYVGCAAIYLLVFMLMGWQVKEGDYPAPPPRKASVLAGLGGWAHECFGISFYRKLYLTGAFYWFGYAAVTFNQLFALKTLGVSKADYGSATGASLLFGLPFFFVIGPLADKFKAVRLISVGHAAILIAATGSFLFIRDARTFYGWTIANGIANTIYLACQISLMPTTLPREQYGQYASANGMLKSITYAAGGILSGWAVSLLSNDYRVAYAWQAGFALAGTIVGFVIYEHWKRLGGDRYVAPTLPEPQTDVLAVAPAPTSLPDEMASPHAKPDSR